MATAGLTAFAPSQSGGVTVTMIRMLTLAGLLAALHEVRTRLAEKYTGGTAEEQPSALAAARDGQVVEGEELYEEEPMQFVETRTVAEEDRIGRNDPCPCGSGKKYKKCHGA